MSGEVEHLKTKKEMYAQNLTKQQVEDYSFAIAYWSGTNIYAMAIDYGINDYLIFAINVWSMNSPKFYKRKIYYTDNDAYIVLWGQRLKLSEFIRK